MSDIANVKDERWNHPGNIVENQREMETIFRWTLNTENPREQLDALLTIEVPVECFSIGEVKKQM